MSEEQEKHKRKDLEEGFIMQRQQNGQRLSLDYTFDLMKKEEIYMEIRIK